MSTSSDAINLGPHLTTRWLGRVIEVHDSLPSTNDRARMLAREGAAHGTVITADTQTQGRGQHQRKWFSPPGLGLYASIIVRPELSPRMAPALTLLTGVAVREAIETFCSTPLRLRWPNDLLVGEPGSHYGKKVCGILVESSMDTFKIDHVVIGVGINVGRADFPEVLNPAAISLVEFTAQPIDRSALLAAVCQRLEAKLDLARSEGLAPVAKAWTEYAFGLGEMIDIDDGQRLVHGRLLGIGEDGCLRVETPTGVTDVYRGELQIPGVARLPDYR